MIEKVQNSLGRLVIVFNELEDYIKLLVIPIICNDRLKSEIEISRLNISPLCDRANDLFILKINDENLLNFFNDLLPQIRYCIEGRNYYIHSTWYFEELVQQLYRAKQDKKKINNIGEYYTTFFTQTVNYEDIDFLIEVITDTKNGLLELLMNMEGIGIPALPMIPVKFPSAFHRTFKARASLPKLWLEDK